jgi:hypothetical protein
MVIEAAAQGAPSLTVWGGGRLRVCRTKLRLGALTAERVTVEVEGGALRVAPE